MDFGLSQFFPDVLRVFDLGGVLVAGIIGGMAAREKHFDIIGFFAISTIAALGGGMLRDVLLQSGAPVALQDRLYLPMAIVGAVVAFSLRLSGKWWNRFFIVADAFVVGAWAATGALKTLSLGFGVFPALMLGVITAVGGGAIRDIFVGRVPAVFGGNTLYASAALAGVVPAIVFWNLHMPTVATVASTLIGGGLCIAARWFKWRLPEHKTFFVSDAACALKARAQQFNNSHREAKKSLKKAASSTAPASAVSMKMFRVRRKDEGSRR